MRRPLPPLILPQSSRAATIPRDRARALLAGIALLLIAMLLLPAADATPDIMRQAGFHGAIVERLRHGGEDYYTATAAALRGSDLPLRPFTAFPLPATGIVAAIVPSVILLAMLAWLAGGVAAVWSRALSPSRRARHGCFLLAIAGVVGAMQAGLAVLPQLWAGLFLALSLALRRPDRWIESTVLGLAAALLHEGAALYLIVMVVTAGRGGARREVGSWVAALMLAGIVIAIHAGAATDAAAPLDLTTEWMPAGPIAALGALGAATGLSLLPAGVGVVLLPVAVFGWLGWRHPLATRALAFVIAGLVLVALLPATYAATAFVIAPLALLGLLPAIEGLRDLVAAALDSRRITVTRMVR